MTHSCVPVNQPDTKEAKMLLKTPKKLQKKVACCKKCPYVAL